MTSENFDELSKVELRRIVLDINQPAERRTAAVDALCRSWHNSGYAAGVDDSRYDNWEDEDE